MVLIRKLIIFLMIGFLFCTSCAPETNAETSLPTTIQDETPRATAGEPTDVPESPICFTPQELSPFALSADNTELLVRLNQGVQIIDLQTGKETKLLKAPMAVFAADLSPDGETLAWSLEDLTIQVVQISDATVKHNLIGHPDPVLHLRFSPVGDRLFSASHDGFVRVWDTQTEVLVTAIDIGREVVGFGLSPDGKILATIPADGPVQLWEISSNQEVATLGGSGGYDTSEAAFSPNGQYLAADLATGLFLWQLSDGQMIWNEVQNSMAVAYSPEGQFLAYSNIDDGNNVFLAPPDGRSPHTVVDQMQGPVWQLFFSPDGTRLVATDGVEIRVWHIPDGRLLATGKAACP
jgi:WD40 repeat protein